MKYYSTTKRKKIIVFSIVSAILIGFIIFLCYKSEPKFINDVYRKPVVGDYVAVISGSQYDDASEKTWLGLVVQTDSVSFSFRFNSGLLDRRNSNIISAPFNNSSYKILGKGTFYHKANQYVGFNIMAITIWINVVLAFVVLRGLTLLLWDILE